MHTLLTAVLAASLLLGQAPAASDIALKDQYGGIDSVVSRRGEIAVVLVVTARRLRTVRPWERALQEHREGLQTILIADVPDDPPAEYARVAEKLGKRVPEGIPVLIDMDRAWAREFDLDTSEPNLLLLDRDGNVVASVRGRWSSEAGDVLFAAIDRLFEGP